MKIKANYVLREIAGTWVVLPVADEIVNFNGMMNLNDTGAFLWNILANGADINQLAEAIVQEYGVQLARAFTDAERFIEKLRAVGCIEE